MAAVKKTKGREYKPGCLSSLTRSLDRHRHDSRKEYCIFGGQRIWRLSQDIRSEEDNIRKQGNGAALEAIQCIINTHRTIWERHFTLMLVFSLTFSSWKYLCMLVKYFYIMQAFNTERSMLGSSGQLYNGINSELWSTVLEKVSDVNDISLLHLYCDSPSTCALEISPHAISIISGSLLKFVVVFFVFVFVFFFHTVLGLHFMQQLVLVNVIVHFC